MSDFNPSKADQSSQIHTRRITSSYFSSYPRPQCLLAFQKTLATTLSFYLKSLELDKVRCVVGLVEQNMAPKVKAATRKNKDKSPRIGKKLPKRTRGVKMKPSFFATVLSSLDGGDKPWALDLENLALKKT